MDIKDPAVEKTELVIDGLKYAHDHNLDINSKEDVKKILEALNSDSSDEEAEKFMELLQSAHALMEIQAAKKEAKKSDLPN